MRSYNDKMSALRYVDSVCLAALESALFLDTHPDDCVALESFRRYNSMCNQAKSEYSKKYGPLTLAHAGDCKNWEWVNQPWPWEGGAC